MSRLKLAATAAALLGGLALASAAQAFTFLDLSSNGAFYNYNSVTGAISGLTVSNTPVTSLEGLGQLGTTVFAESGTELYTLSESGTSITETAVGASGLTGGVSIVDFGSTTGGLFAVGSNGDLYSINQTTGAATDIASLGLGSSLSRTSGSGHSETVILAMSAGGSSLYFDDSGSMYTIDTTSGHATLLGAISTSPSSTNDGSEFGALLVESGTLYGGANTCCKGSHTGLFSFDATHLVDTYVSETSPNNSHQFAFLGMAPGFGVKVLPEPSEWALMVFGVGAVGGALRARRRKATAAT
jgi:hypothetical protein